MGSKLLQLFVYAILFLLVSAYPATLKAQDIDEDALVRDTTNVFCKQLASIIAQIDTHFDKAKDSLMGASAQKTWDCKDSFKMNGARTCTIYQNGFTTMYVAFFLSRDTKDALESSYHNLCHQLKDCMGANYVYKEQKTTNADKLLGIKNYQCEMRPATDYAPEQADMLVSVQKDAQSGNYELVLEIQKYTGYY